MLDQINLSQSLTKHEYKRTAEELFQKLSLLQRQLKDVKIPVGIVFEGWSASGKGTLINEVIHALDPRGFRVISLEDETEEEKRHSFFWPFWNTIPPKGRIHLFNNCWYSRVLEKKRNNENVHLQVLYNEINSFESQLTKDGCLLVKFFLHISKDEQKERFDKLESCADTRWRVEKKDWKENKNYKERKEEFDRMLVETDTPWAPWNLIEATDKRYAAAKILSILVREMEKSLYKKQQKAKEKAAEQQNEKEEMPFQTKVLKGIDLSKEMKKEKYKERVEELQNRLVTLHNRMYREKVPVIIALEGWDAAGKGGAIKRITEKIDPRGYEVVPVSSPNDLERQYHYLWRFWSKFPKSGHLAIFDRTWYGRVLVERVEGFATREEWTRAYTEINEMEESLYQDGYVLLKFWLQIDKEEQKRRFEERQNTPGKQWKITEEDWRNRAKWDEYEVAIDEMLVKTSASYAPWHVIEANSKYYARIKILETIVNALEKRMK
ncbi:polyphosphate:AMP phosphotransferase [[Clostridium] polysaccharolyticum]|uniref:Polyphosphate:AMP phosphotransferase n=1 Tax=[Clostridium] polysaccharolyticum TaxID=29364 RepID=A0A1I0B4P8_9FIRM|nr:polyphosphate:AMP phosphotransferase [[Clostridium] polysaccharolyticum]SET01080.1 polyphosphate:AMP phosphotransferase [[Clostridium] polysaccharolyticum]